jgi:hypothetical protein
MGCGVTPKKKSRNEYDHVEIELCHGTAAKPKKERHSSGESVRFAFSSFSLSDPLAPQEELFVTLCA